MSYPTEMEHLIDSLATLPGIGPKAAERIAVWMLSQHAPQAATLSHSITQASESIRPCTTCGFFTNSTLCTTCADTSRDHSKICVVEQAIDVIPIERSGAYQGVYHCLGGKLSPLDDIEPDDLTISALIDRVRANPHCEVILATGSDVEGEATAAYISMLLKPLPCSISRLAQGLPAGAGLSHADALTLSRALTGRTSVE